MTGIFIVHNLKRRIRDGFSIMYNLIFPILITLLLGVLTTKLFSRGVSSYQYYGVVSIPFSITFSLVTAIYAAKDDAYAKTAVRIMISPIKVVTIVWSKVIACTSIFTVLSMICLSLIMLIFKLPSDLLSWIVILLFFTCFNFGMSAFGTWIGLSTSSFLTIKNVITIPVGVFASIGGSFFPVRSSNERLNMIFSHSPFHLINKAFFMQIYDHNSKLLCFISILFFMVGVTFTVLSVKYFKREEYIHGDIPGYEN